MYNYGDQYRKLISHNNEKKMNWVMVCWKDPLSKGDIAHREAYFTDYTEASMYAEYLDSFYRKQFKDEYVILYAYNGFVQILYGNVGWMLEG